MVVEQIYGKYFALTNGDMMKCSCCGKDIKKGYSVLGANLGLDCYDNINQVLKRGIVEGSEMAKMFQIQPRHFAWIKSR